MIDPEDIIRSERDIRPHVRTTPVERSGSLVGDGCDVVHLKLENQQETGSFKLRGAFNRLLQLDESERSVGVVAASTGNHGAAVARAGRRLGVPVRVFVPRDAEPGKLAAIENDGAVIRDEVRRLNDSMRPYFDAGRHLFDVDSYMTDRAKR